MSTGVMVVLATMGAVALVAIVAALVTLRRSRQARKQTRRALALLERHAEDWPSVTAGAPGHDHADRPGQRRPDRSTPEPRRQAESSPRHALPVAAHHERQAS